MDFRFGKSRFDKLATSGVVLTDCNGSANSTLLVDYITLPSAGWPTNSGSSPTPPDWAGNLWPTAPTCPTGSLPAVSVQLTVNVDPVGHPFERYELQDSIGRASCRERVCLVV